MVSFWMHGDARGAGAAAGSYRVTSQSEQQRPVHILYYVRPTSSKLRVKFTTGYYNFQRMLL